jgi:transposase
MVFMQTRREKLDYGAMMVPCLESLVPGHHRLRKLDAVLDLSFIHDAVRPLYCQDNGRPSIDPEVVMRLFILQAIQNIRSVRELMDEVAVNLAYRWFIGYSLEEKLPDHSTLSRALDRFGNEVFDTLFQRSIAQCQASGLIEGRVLHLDATLIRADLDKDKAEQPGCADPDARFGRKKGEPGYKQQAVADGKARVVVAVDVMPANEHESERAMAMVDQAMTRTGERPQAVCADSAYANSRNAAAMEAREVEFLSPPQRTRRTCDDQLTADDFVYDTARDVYICPAQQDLVYIGADNTKKHRRRYRAPTGVCITCPLRPRCTKSKRRVLHVRPHHDALARLRAAAKTDRFRALYRMRQAVIEGVNGEAKQWHGLRRAARRGLANVLIQCLLVAAVLNFKRLMAAQSPIAWILWAISAIDRTARRVWGATRAGQRVSSITNRPPCYVA